MCHGGQGPNEANLGFISDMFEKVDGKRKKKSRLEFILEIRK